MDINKWFSENTQSLKGKTVAITGATGGLGNSICRHLAKLDADLILMDRNKERSAKFGNDLSKEFPDIKISYITVDMENFESVNAAAEALFKTDIDIFIANAGAYNIPRKKCPTGFDNIFQINFVSPYYIINKILPKLRTRKGKVLAIGSLAHMGVKINPNDTEYLNCKNNEKIYGNSKRFFMFSLFELFKNEREVSLSIVHPGITYTNLMTNYPKPISEIIKYPMKIIFMSPEKASLSVIKGIFASCDTYEWIGPKIFAIWGYPYKAKIKMPSADEREVIMNTVEKIASLNKKETDN